jgi:Arc/MetJ-type ribon-helix-helix transcriptional regulator
MRQILSLSLPEQITEEIKKNSKKRGFSSVSSYVKYLFEQDRNLISEKELLDSVNEARKDYKRGKTVKAKSLADLV